MKGNLLKKHLVYSELMGTNGLIVTDADRHHTEVVLSIYAEETEPLSPALAAHHQEILPDLNVVVSVLREHQVRGDSRKSFHN